MTQDISLEPLFNQGAQGSGASRKPGMIPVDTVGVASNRSAISVTASAQEITITVGNRTIELQNTGSSNIYYGGSGVDDTDGLKLFPNQTKIYANVKDDFSVYIVTATGETSTCRVVEYT